MLYFLGIFDGILQGRVNNSSNVESQDMRIVYNTVLAAPTNAISIPDLDLDNEGAYLLYFYCPPSANGDAIELRLNNSNSNFVKDRLRQSGATVSGASTTGCVVGTVDGTSRVTFTASILKLTGDATNMQIHVSNAGNQDILQFRHTATANVTSIDIVAQSAANCFEAGTKVILIRTNPNPA